MEKENYLEVAPGIYQSKEDVEANERLDDIRAYDHTP